MGVLPAPVSFIIEVFLSRVDAFANVSKAFSVNETGVGVPLVDDVKGDPKRLNVVLENLIWLVGLGEESHVAVESDVVHFEVGPEDFVDEGLHVFLQLQHLEGG